MKVLSVKRITTNTPVDVYDISVPGLENFCLANGVVVHNSKDCADAMCGAYHTLLTRSASWSLPGGRNMEYAGDRADLGDRMDPERM